MTFRIGQKVVCVDDNWTEWCIRRIHPVERDPVLGGIYTIRSIHDLDGCFLRFEEIVNPGCNGQEVCFEAAGFRPIVETDISVFTSMLNNVPLHEKETVGDRN